MIFGIKKKIDPYNVLLAIAANMPVLLKTGFVVQGHILASSAQDKNSRCSHSPTSFLLLCEFVPAAPRHD